MLSKFQPKVLDRLISDKSSLAVDYAEFLGVNGSLDLEGLKEMDMNRARS